MKFRMMINDDIPLDQYINPDLDTDLYNKILDHEREGDRVKIAFEAMKKRIHHNFETAYPVGFIR